MKLKITILCTFLSTIIFLGSCKKKNETPAAPATPVPVTPTPTVAPTNTAVPTVETLNISNITDSSAVSGGTVTKEGASVIIAVGVVWDESPNPTLLKNKTMDGAGIGSYTSKMSGLKPNTTYYVRAYATNVAGTAYGTEISFKTSKTNKWQGWGNGIPFGTYVIDFVSLGNDLYAAGNNGIYKSSNGDNNWSQVNTGASSGIVRLLNKNGTLVAGTQNDGVYISTNGGSNWTQSNSGLNENSIVDMAISGNNIIAATYDHIYISTNDGGSWSDITPTLSSLLISKVGCLGSSIFMYDYNNGKMYLSQDNGSIWNPTTDIPQQPMVLTLRGIESYMYAGTFGGLYRSSDDGASWASADYGMGSYPVYSIIKSSGTMYAGNTQGVYTSANNGSNWNKLGTGLPINSNYTTLHVHLGMVYLSGTFNNGGVYRFEP